MTTAPRGAAPEEIRSRLDTGQDIKPPRCPQQKSHAAQRLNRLTSRLDGLAIWRDDILDRIDHAKQMQDAGCLFAAEQDDLIDAVKAWKLAAARVALDLADIGDVRSRA